MLPKELNSHAILHNGSKSPKDGDDPDLCKGISKLFSDGEKNENSLTSPPITKSASDIWKLGITAKLHTLGQTTSSAAASDICSSQDCGIYRLPDEIWLKIIGHLYTDDASFFCLRQVSRRIRRIANGVDFRHHPFSTYHECSDCYSLFTKCEKGMFASFLIPAQPKPGCLIGARLRRDRLCQACRIAHKKRQLSINLSKSTFRDSLRLNVGSPYVREYEISCKFYPKERVGYLYCSGCNLDHPATLFSVKQLGKSRDRICIGREGHVRLCDHKVITWADVEARVARWRKDGALQSDARDIIQYCLDPVHSSGCGLGIVPLARLDNVKPQYGSNYLTVTMFWEPHSTVSLIGDAHYQHIQDSEARDMILTKRADVGRYILPPLFPGNIPEVQCFKAPGYCYPGKSHPDSTSACQSMSHDRLTRDVLQLGGSFSTPGIDFNKGPWCRISISHCSSSSCIIMKYERKISFSRVQETTGKANPDHYWHHALEPASYEMSNQYALGARGTCQDTSCWNSYPKLFCDGGLQANIWNSTVRESVKR